LAVNPSDYPILDEILMRHGTLRGLLLNAKRETAKCPKTGNFSYVGFISEEEMISNFGNKPFTRDGVVVKRANENLEEIDFHAIYGQPNLEKLINKYGGAPVIGTSVGDALVALHNEFDDTIPY
jgi:hypothetical protein